MYYYYPDGPTSVAARCELNNVLVEQCRYDIFAPATLRGPNGNEIKAGACDNPYPFIGRAYDAEMALYYYRACYHDESIGTRGARLYNNER